MLIQPIKLQRGVTLVELMIGLAVGLIVVGAVLSVYLTTVNTSGETLKSSRLNQQVSAIMNVMSNDIRRAGYAEATPSFGGYDWDDPGDLDVNDLDNIEEPSTNPFNQPGSTALEVHDTMASDSDVGSLGWGECILYAYDASKGDADDDGTPGPDGDVNTDGFRIMENNEYFGFRKNGTNIDMRKSIDYAAGDTPNSCASAGSGSWEAMNDPTIEITTLEFNLRGSSCVNTQEPDKLDSDGDGTIDDLDESDCYTHVPAVGSGINTVERRDVEITIGARLAGDPEVKISVTQHVSVRNDLVRLR